MKKSFPYGDAFPLWGNLSLMEKPCPYGEAFPLWRSLSLSEKPFPYVEAYHMLCRLTQMLVGEHVLLFTR